MKPSKKALILLILRLIENETDRYNVLSQTKIAEIISGVMPCDRKTVGRNIQFLIDCGYPIVKTRKGVYMDSRVFTIEEKDFILNAVMQAEGKTNEEKLEIVKKINTRLNDIFRR